MRPHLPLGPISHERAALGKQLKNGFDHFHNTLKRFCSAFSESLVGTSERTGTLSCSLVGSCSSCLNTSAVTGPNLPDVLLQTGTALSPVVHYLGLSPLRFQLLRHFTTFHHYLQVQLPSYEGFWFFSNWQDKALFPLSEFSETPDLPCY